MCGRALLDVRSCPRLQILRPQKLVDVCPCPHGRTYICWSALGPISGRAWTSLDPLLSKCKKHRKHDFGEIRNCPFEFIGVRASHNFNVAHLQPTVSSHLHPHISEKQMRSCCKTDQCFLVIMCAVVNYKENCAEISAWQSYSGNCFTLCVA